MEAHEAQELKEHAEHGAHEATLRPVAFTMSVLAVLVAVTTVLGHRTHTEAVLYQNKATDHVELNIRRTRFVPTTRSLPRICWAWWRSRTTRRGKDRQGLCRPPKQVGR